MAAVQAWATEQRLANPGLKRVGVFGSYGRGTAAVGSDLDLLLVDASAEGPQHLRLLHWPLERLPLRTRRPAHGPRPDGRRTEARSALVGPLTSV
jgi:hypothetical protein